MIIDNIFLSNSPSLFKNVIILVKKECDHYSLVIFLLIKLI